MRAAEPLPPRTCPASTRPATSMRRGLSVRARVCVCAGVSASAPSRRPRRPRQRLRRSSTVRSAARRTRVACGWTLTIRCARAGEREEREERERDLHNPSDGQPVRREPRATRLSQVVCAVSTRLMPKSQATSTALVGSAVSLFWSRMRLLSPHTPCWRCPLL